MSLLAAEPAPVLTDALLWLGRNSLGGAALIVTTSATMHEDTSATPGVLYYYFVRALDSDNDLGNADTTSPHNDGLRATGPLDGQLTQVQLRRHCFHSVDK